MASDESQRKRRRMESNRESARRSRLRKQQRLEELAALAARLCGENLQMGVQIGAALEQRHRVEACNAALRGELEALRQRLRRANSVLRIYEEFSGVEMEVKEEPEDAGTPPGFWRPPMPFAFPSVLPVLTNAFPC